MRAVDTYRAFITFETIDSCFFMSPETILNRFDKQSLVCYRGIDVKHLNFKNNILLIRDYKQLLEE